MARNPADRPLPSIARHVVAALLTLAMFGAGAWLVLSTGEVEQAWATSEVTLPERGLPPTTDNLLADDEAGLPDLLREVAANANPTEGLVAPPSSPKGKRLELPTRNVALPSAPVAKLEITGPFGRMPVRASDGSTAFAAYSRPFEDTDKQNLSLVVGGLGIDPDVTRRAIEELPPEITLAFAAHASGLQDYITSARAAGHEVVLEIPLEGARTNVGEPGADRTLRIGQTESNARHIDFLLSRGTGYFAVMPYNGELFLASPNDAKALSERLHTAGLGLLTDGESTADGLSGIASEADLPFRDGSLLIDVVPMPSTVAQNLEDLRARALAGNAPIGFGFAYPQTVDAILAWLPTLERVELAPASAAMR